MKVRAAFCLAISLSGCAVDAVHVQTPFEAVGTVANPNGTGWTKDFCNGGHLVESAADCLQIGGEIYRVNLLNVRTPDGNLIAKKLIIGFPAHALTKKYRGRKHLRLESSPEDFRRATGIELVATDWSDT